jgi:class 3 adenylate cyclase
VRKLFARLFDIATLPADSHDTRLQKRLQVAMAIASIPVVGAWGLLFIAQGHARLALWHAGYCVGSLLLVVFVGATKRYSIFRALHPLFVMLAPFGLHLELGGFRGSGGAILWCLLAPIASMMFAGARRSWSMFLGMMLLVAIAWVREVPLAPASYVLTPDEVSFHVAFNTIGFVAFLYLSTRYFVSRIDAEKARSEALLLNVLPGSIAERLKKEEGTIADRFECATVLFTDIVGFTPLAAKLDAEGVVKLLDEIFSAFDEIAGRFGLEKIKTIGDAYMLVGGVPEARADHAERVADAALAMRDFLERYSSERTLAISMRIGIHAGSVVAGVIGKKKFAYDLWGDTVNTASRMESHGAPGKIHVSDAVRERLGAAYRFEERGAVTLKGKGELRTFWLVGRASA